MQNSKKFLVSRSLLAVGGLALILGFQNCGSGMSSISGLSANPPLQTPNNSLGTEIWFSPLPPVNSVPGGGATDFASLFSSTSNWPIAIKNVQVFKLYGEFLQESTQAQITQAVIGIKNAGMKLAVEAGPLPDTAGSCGVGHESFTLSIWPGILSSIQAAGSTLDYVDMDEPFYYGTTVCNWTPQQIAANVKNFVDLVHAQFPNAVIGGAEPLLGTSPASVAGLLSWISAYQAAVGAPLAWLHLDTSPLNTNWLQDSLSLKSQAQIPIGMIFQPGDYPTNQSWIAASGEYLRAAIAGGFHPDHTIFQSWTKKPSLLMPETSSVAFTSLIKNYVSGVNQIGFTSIIANLPSVVTASSELSSNPAHAAVDGDYVSTWSSGAGAPGWIQLDLGSVKNIAEIRLTVSQSPAGATVHEVSGSTDGSSWTLLKTFSGTTSDLQFLNFFPDSSAASWRYIRIVTQSSPSWVAWREIQAIDANAVAN